MSLMKVNYLKPGDTVGIVSLSWGGPSIYPAVYDNGLKVLKEWGLNVKEFPTARSDAVYLHDHPEVRAKDLNDAFADQEVKAIITTIGGDDSIRILPLLNPELIKANPKIFMGYSDTTAQHFFLGLLGMTSFYGPSIMGGFSQMHSLEPEFREHVRQVLFGDFKGNYRPYKQYCNGYPDWAEAANIGKVNELKPNDGWHWLQGEGVAEGKLFGGCIELFQMLNGTVWWPKPEFWEDKILFFETSEDVPAVSYVEHQLRNMGIQDIFKHVKGLIIGRPRDYSDKDKQELERRILDQVQHEFRRPDLPVIANFDTGHSDPQLILPINFFIQIDCSNQLIKFL